MSALTSIETRSGSRPTLIKAARKTISEIDNMGIDLYCEWIPSHIDVHGNDIADDLAKQALSKAEVDLHILPGEKEVTN